MTDRFVNIHTHRPTGRGIELRTAGIHPWNADKEDVSTIAPLLGDVQAVGETGLDFAIRSMSFFWDWVRSFLSN